MNEEAEERPPPSLDLTFEWLKGVLPSQAADGDVLDRKASILFVLGTAIIGIGIPFAVASVGVRLAGAEWTMLSLALLSYVFVAGFSLFILWPRPWSTLDDPVVFREDYWDMSHDKFREQILGFTEDSYEENEVHLKSKAAALKSLFIALPAEALAVLFLVVILLP